MKQEKLINDLIEDLKNLGYIKACYLGGALGRGVEDQYADVDLYCCFSPEYEEDYERIKFKLFERYASIAYYKTDIRKENNKNIYIETIVYVDGLILRIHHIYENVDGIIEVDCNNKIIYNDLGVLIESGKSDLNLTNEELGKLIDGLALDGLEFYYTYMRNDYPGMMLLSTKMFENFSIILRYFDKPNNAKLASINIMSDLNDESKRKYIDVIRNYSFNKIKQFVVLMLKTIDKYLISVPVFVAEHFNYDFYKFVLDKFMD